MKARRLTCTLFAACMLMTSALSAGAVSINSGNTTDDFDYDLAYQWAVDSGFSEGFLNNISAESLRQVYYDNKDAENFEIEEEVGILPSETNISTTRAGNIGTDAMEFRSSAVKHTTGKNGTVVKVNIYFTAQWLNGKPLNRANDAITSNWDSSLWYCDTSSFWGRVEDVSNGSSATADVVYSSTRPAKNEQGGLGWYAPLQYSPLGFTPTVRIGYVLYPRNSTMPEGTKYVSSVTATYGHTYNSITGISFGVTGGSISMSGQATEAAASCKIQHG